MDINEQILEELKQIKKLLVVVSQEKLVEFNKQIEKEFLTTKQRKGMYDLFDGTKSLKEISEIINISFEAVRLFASSLENAGYLEYVINSKSKCPKRIY